MNLYNHYCKIIKSYDRKQFPDKIMLSTADSHRTISHTAPNLPLISAGSWTIVMP